MSVVLPEPVAPTMPTRSPGPDLEAHVLQHVVGVVVRHRADRHPHVAVGEPHVIEHDVPRRRDRPRRTGRAGDCDRSTGSSSSLKIRSDDAIADCRTLNFSDMSLIGRKNRCEYWRNATSAPSVSVLPQHARAAVPDDQRRRQRADRLDRRVEHRVVEDRLDVGVAVLAIDLVEALEVQRLPPEQLHRRHAGDVLLQERVDARDPAADHAVRVADVAAEPLRDERRSAAARRTRPAPAASSSTSITPMMPTSVNTSPKIVTTPDVNRSLSTSTSDVTRVISRPTGLRS